MGPGVGAINPADSSAWKPGACSPLDHDRDTKHEHGRESDGGRLHWPVDFFYLLNSRDVEATVQGVGEAGCVGLRRKKATVRMGSLEEP